MTEKQEYPFLGTGWSFPPDFPANGAQVEMEAGVENVQKSIQILLETSLGERIMRDDFGCGLKNYLFEPVNERLLNNLSQTITTAIRKYEPRVKLDKVSIDPDQTDAGRLFIRLMYTVKSTNSRFNMVFPFYFADALAGEQDRGKSG